MALSQYVKVDPSFIYCSDNNKDWMNIETLELWIEKHKATIGKF